MRRGVILVTLTLAVVACGEAGPAGSPAASGPPTGSPPPAVGVLGRPEVTPIRADFVSTGFRTEYTALVSLVSEELNVTYRWSGPNCDDWGPMGDQTLSTRLLPGERHDKGLLTIWSHRHPPCAATTNHSDVLVTLTVSNSKGTTVCVYQGSESGFGPTCQPL